MQNEVIHTLHFNTVFLLFSDIFFPVTFVFLGKKYFGVVEIDFILSVPKFEFVI